MGIIVRHAGAPFVDGETLAGADLEGDFSTIYDEFNGNIESANLADDAVTTSKILDANVTANKIAAGSISTAKLADGAVTQAKMTDGAASASETMTDSSTLNVTTSFQTIGTSISHDVGDPARHVLLYWVARVSSGAAGHLFTFQLLKDGVLVAGSTLTANTPSGATPVSGVAFDAAPTPGGTHVYELQVKSFAGGEAIIGANLVAFEPRS